MVKLIGWSTPTRRTFRRTGVPTGPRSTFTAASSVHPPASLPSLSRSWSPTRLPARSAGGAGGGAAHADACALGGGAGEHARGGDVLLARGDLDPQPAVFAAGLQVELRVLVGRHEHGVRVAQLVQHPLDGLLVEVALGVLVDVAGLHVAQHLVEDRRALVHALPAPPPLLQ